MKILLIEDHPLFRSALKEVLRDLSPSVELLEACCMGEAFKLLEQHSNINLVLFDWTLPDGGGLKSLLAICQLVSDVPVVVISAIEEYGIITTAINAGAKGYIPKSADQFEILAALRMILKGETYMPPAVIEGMQAGEASSGASVPDLTVRQQNVLHLVAKGLSNKIIAEKLNIKDTTVRAHVSDILKQLEAKNRTDAVIKAGYLGILD